MARCWQLALVFVVGGAGALGCSDEPVDEDCFAAAAGSEGALYLRGAAVATGEGTAEEGLALLVHDGEIHCLEPEPEEPPEGAEVVDLGGLTLLPGLIDAHVHVALDEEDLSEPMDLFLDHGVTTVRDLGSSLDRILELRDQVEAGDVEGPRIVAAGPFLTAPGGHPVATLWPGEDELIESAGRQLDDPEEARLEVRLLAEAGVDLIKAVLTACELWSGGRCERLEPEVLAAIVDEARALGLDVAVHTDAEEDAVDAVESGVTSLEHGRIDGVLSDALTARIASAGIFYVPTVAVSVQSDRVEERWFYDNLAALRSAGARVAVGTDAANGNLVWGEAYLTELEHFVAAGWTPAETIDAATRGGAELIGLGDELGSIEVGRRADLIAVPGDPFGDIGALGDVRLVVARGEVLRNRLAER